MTEGGLTLRHVFVQSIPRELERDTLYVSMGYATAVHQCCCGCGREVVTPISPTGWSLRYDGATVSLDPSIGNWSYPCQSHYWICRDRVVWAPRWSRERIDAGRASDQAARDRYNQHHTDGHDDPVPPAGTRRREWMPRLEAWLRCRILGHRARRTRD